MCRPHTGKWTIALRMTIGYAILIFVIVGIVSTEYISHKITDRKVTDINQQVRPWLLASAAAQGLMLAGNCFLVLNFVRLSLAKPAANAANLFRQPAVMEASVS